MNHNSGKPSEERFEEIYERMGKRAFLFRLVDTAELQGRLKKRDVHTRSQPSDFIITEDGEMFYGEVKSTVDHKAFKICQLSKNQRAAAIQQRAAGGKYYIFIHALITDDWYRVPADFLLGLKKSRATWAELSQFRWSLAYA